MDNVDGRTTRMCIRRRRRKRMKWENVEEEDSMAYYPYYEIPNPRISDEKPCPTSLTPSSPKH
jgi:hypothetical protein